MDLPTLLGVKDGIKDFQAKIKKSFPILEPVEKNGLSINANNNGSFIVGNNPNNNINWNFRSKDRMFECNIDELSLIFISSNYLNYTEYKKVLELIVRSFNEVYGDVTTQRIGFRYINEIKLPEELSMKDCLSGWLFRDDTFFTEGHEKLRGMSKFEFSLNALDRMNLVFGNFNANYPQPVNSKEFILDYDCHTTEPIEAISDLLTKLDDYNKIITLYFEQSITQVLKDYLNNK